MGAGDRKVRGDQTQAGTEASGEVGEATETKGSGARIMGRVAEKVVLNEHHSPAIILPDADRQDETKDIGLESMRTRKTGGRCSLLPYLVFLQPQQPQ
jgi:hypothetical protein